ncbi:chromate transporter [Bacillus piscicola]|uniref:chromate transporter n=1 Tax=Bacillus piscicola TaxID=1632684 RepID=UPI001F093AE5|nr:chromate transporter [Bacillus piscicola]
MTYLYIFVAFLLPGILGYGGGPAAIPLVQYEVVNRYGWMTMGEFSEVVAIANALPGPIATKMAGYIGYEVGGVFGAVVAVFATVAPSLILMIVLVSLLLKYRDSPKIKRLTMYVRPVIAILLGIITFQFLGNSLDGAGTLQTVLLIVVSFLMLERWKIHPALVIVLAIGYGAVFLG